MKGLILSLIFALAVAPAFATPGLQGGSSGSVLWEDVENIPADIADGDDTGASGSTAISISTDALITADSDDNGSGGIWFRIGSSTAARILNDGNFKIENSIMVSTNLDGGYSVYFNGDMFVQSTTTLNDSLNLLFDTGSNSILWRSSASAAEEASITYNTAGNNLNIRTDELTGSIAFYAGGTQRFSISNFSGNLTWADTGARVDFGAAADLEIPAAETGAVSESGEIRIDTNYFGTGAPAILFHDGTETSYALSSTETLPSIPAIYYFDGDSFVAISTAGASAGQVLEINAGGTGFEFDTDDAGSGGASTLSVGTGTTGAYVEISSPTSRLSFDTNQFTGQLLGSSTAFIQVKTGGIGATEIEDGSVGTADVENNSLTADDLAADSVGESELIESMNYTGTGVWNLPELTVTTLTFNGADAPLSVTTHTTNTFIVGDSTFIFNTAGNLLVNGSTATTLDNTQTLTNKTLDTQSTGNVFSWLDYWQFGKSPDSVDGTNVTHSTDTEGNPYYGSGKFSNSVSSESNHATWVYDAPPDFDTSEAVIFERFCDYLGGADTSTRTYVVSVATFTTSATLGSLTFTDAVTLNVLNDGSGASGDLECTDDTTLTGWKDRIVGGNRYAIRVHRDGDAANDVSSTDSYSGGFLMKFGRSQ